MFHAIWGSAARRWAAAESGTARNRRAAARRIERHGSPRRTGIGCGAAHLVGADRSKSSIERVPERRGAPPAARRGFSSLAARLVYGWARFAPPNRNRLRRRSHCIWQVAAPRNSPNAEGVPGCSRVCQVCQSWFSAHGGAWLRASSANELLGHSASIAVLVGPDGGKGQVPGGWAAVCPCTL